MKFLSRFCAQILTALIFGLRPLFGPSECRFSPSCTRYAQQQLQEQPLFKAIWATIKRVFSCFPSFT